LPEEDFYRNNVCHEIFFITEGKAKVTIDGETHEVGKGDVVVLEPGQKHYGEYENVSMITVSSPNWYEEQCEVVQ
jgi:mannose-6-phosphate isomerase-like protein (cupin superfamily)